ncbi:MAG TPA: 4-oxalocrotonate tautomerase family protein [Nitrososphaeraceae archaeon]|jgi:4-oxalocrotonate tautomerase|nr:4-oxalocrotonate tautomerase family protein [Nitrososphaeraceae archaeon]
MPLITVSMYPGRSEEKKRLFAEKITNLAVEILKTKPEHVIVVFDENPKDNWYLEGKNL